MWGSGRGEKLGQEKWKSVLVLQKCTDNKTRGFCGIRQKRTLVGFQEIAAERSPTIELKVFVNVEVKNGTIFQILQGTVEK